MLPLKNFSADPEQEYFADGMTEALITNLAKIGALRVISATPVMQYKGRSTDGGILIDLSGMKKIEVYVPQRVASVQAGVRLGDVDKTTCARGLAAVLGECPSVGVSGDAGQIVGRYDDADGIRHGYLLSEGEFSPIDFPGTTFTVAFGINDSGQIVGAYRDADGIRHGYLLSGDSYTTLDPPGSTDTIAWKINDCGLIVGTYVDAGGSNHGFLAIPDEDGRFSRSSRRNGWSDSSEQPCDRTSHIFE